MWLSPWPLPPFINLLGKQGRVHLSGPLQIPLRVNNKQPRKNKVSATARNAPIFFFFFFKLIQFQFTKTHTLLDLSVSLSLLSYPLYHILSSLLSFELFTTVALPSYIILGVSNTLMSLFSHSFLLKVKLYFAETNIYSTWVPKVCFLDYRF